MKKTNILSKMMIAALACGIVVAAPACSDDNKDTGADAKGTLSGVVTARTEDGGAAIEGAAVVVKDGTASVGTATTAADGKYSIADLTTSKTLKVEFSKDGWQSKSSTLNAGWKEPAVVNAELTAANAKIIGTVVDTRNGNAGLAGVTVSATGEGAASAVTGEDGNFVLTNLVKGNYTLTFAFGDLPAPPSVNVVIADFVEAEGIFTANIDTIEMGYNVIAALNKTIAELRDAPELIHFDYGGGGNGFDWSYNYIIAQWGWYGDVESQGEGAALRTVNDEENAQANAPASDDNFVSYFYGKKKITADNQFITIRARTHNASTEAPAYFGVQVVDLALGNDAVAVKAGETKTHAGDAYGDYSFDLSAHVGKEVVVAVGIYRKATGDYWKQLPIRRIAFGSAAVEGNDLVFPNGTEVREDWRFNTDMFPHVPLQTKTTFTGITLVENPGGGNRGTNGYKSWADIDHIAKLWQFVYISKDVEPFPSEGYLIKTRGGGTAINLQTPESYLYAKFAISTGKNTMVLKARNFGSNYTFCSLSAVTSDGAVFDIVPEFTAGDGVDGTGEEAEAGSGVFKFKNDAGGRDNVDKYATLTYDLAQFNGQDVVLMLAIYKGEENGDENKLVIHSVTFE